MSAELKKEYVLLKEEDAILKSIEKSEKEINAGRFFTHEQLIEKFNNLFV